MSAAPFVKWAGGKTQLLSQYDPYIPSSFGQYFEPFVGGGAMFFHLHNRGMLRGKRVMLIDQVEELVNCYQVVQGQVEALVEELERHEPHKQDSGYYYRVRGWDRRPDYAHRSTVERAARFIFLNRTCYNGLYRVNRRGQHNVPFGRHSNPSICRAKDLRAASRALDGVTIVRGDFAYCLTQAQPGDLVYLDPPYHPLSATSQFTNYTSSGFPPIEQRRLAAVFRKLDKLGCQVLLSNSDTGFVRALYGGYEQIQVHAARAISSQRDGRGAIPELLVTSRHQDR